MIRGHLSSREYIEELIDNSTNTQSRVGLIIHNARMSDLFINANYPDEAERWADAQL